MPCRSSQYGLGLYGDKEKLKRCNSIRLLMKDFKINEDEAKKMRDRGKTFKLEWLRQKFNKLVMRIDDEFVNLIKIFL